LLGGPGPASYNRQDFLAPDRKEPRMQDSQGYRTAPDQTNPGWPPGVPYIVGNEVCERFSFYGMRAILYIHLHSLYARAAIETEAEASAKGTTHLFFAGVYALPMIGALIAERWAGKFRTILYLSLVYCAGHAVLSLYENFLWGMYLGLALIAVGSGGIKPCVSANVGDQFGKANWFRVRTVYQIFYFSVNFGSFFSTLLIPLVKDNAGDYLIRWFPGVFGGFDPERLGTSIAFGIPGVLMFIATFIFWLGRREFVHVPARPGGSIGVLDTCCSVALFLTVGHLFFTLELVGHPIEEHFADSEWAARAGLLKWSALLGISVAFLLLGLSLFAVRQRLERDDGFLAITLHVVRSHLGLGKYEGAARKGQALTNGAALARSWFWRPGVEKFGMEATEGPVAVFKIVSVFLLVAVFWSLFDQHSSTWIEQARHMDLRLWGGRDSFLGISNRTLKPSQIPALNPLLVMLLIPLVNLIYVLFDRMGIRTTPLRRVTVGMGFAALAFVVAALLQQRLDSSPPNSISVLWQVPQYLLLTIGEVLVSITGLEFAYTQAPKRMKSTVMGFWYLTISLGNVLVFYLATVQGPMTKWVSANVVRGLSEAATFFWVFAVLSGVAAVIFGVRAMFYTPKDYAQE
jgi:POT family proton-dependent oligopeptide transporter